MTNNSVIEIYYTLLKQYGHQHWWPGDSAFEVIIGAVLTQNTAWSNVEKAIEQLRLSDLLSPHAIVEESHDVIAEAIRPSGYFNVKTKRLKALCEWFMQQGDENSLRKYDTDTLRKMLLSVHGIGPETCDDILLYALDRPVFVIDAYTRRIFSRLGLFSGEEPYDEIRLEIEENLSSSLPGEEILPVYNEYHALVVRHAKEACVKNKPDCVHCCLNQRCPAASVFHPNMV